tara:strand:- start:1988 stop:3064 length:1077 start_codon:yes stop_codon:yes gene_type:complete
MAWPIRAAQSLWNLGKSGAQAAKRPFAGTGWRGGARGIPGRDATPPRLRYPQRGPGWGSVGPRPAGPPKQIPGKPAVPPVAAGFARRRPIATATGLGIAGALGSSLWPDGTPKEQPQPQPQMGLGGVPTGPAAMPDTFQSQLPGLVQRRQEERNSFLDNMQMVLGHSILLSFQNPGRESKYVENAIALLKGDAKSKGALEDAKIIEEVFKDNKVPKSAKTLYNRLVKHVGPKKAAEVSGYTLEIDKAESKAATDYMKAVADARKAEATGMGTKSYRLQQIIEMSQMPGQFEAAVLALAMEWGAGGTLEIRDIYGGYVGDKSMEEMKKKARDLLSGQTGGGAAGVPESQEVSETEVISP